MAEITDRPTTIPAVPRVRNEISPAVAKERRLSLKHGSDWAGIFGRQSTAGKPVNLTNAMTLSSVWACIRQTAQTCASLPIDLIDNRSGDRRVIEDDLAEILTVSPNSRQTAMEHWEGQVAWLLANGNCYAEKTTIGRRLVALNPLEAPRVEPMLRTDGSLFYRCGDRGKYEDLPAEKVFHVRGFGFGGLKGLSAIRHGVNSLGAGVAADETAARMFGQGMHASGFLKVDQELTEAQREMLQKLLEQYRSSENAGKMMVLGQGMEWTPLSLNPEDAQMLETRRFSVEDVCRWFGTPPIVIGHAPEGQTMYGQGVEHIMLAWQSLGLNPLLRRIEARIGKDLIPPERRRRQKAEFNREGILQMDSKAKAEFLQKMVNAGVMTPNEARAKLNLPPLSGGDQLLVQGAMISLAQLTSTERPDP